MYPQDVSLVNSWLTLYSGADRFKFFWSSGNQLHRYLNNLVDGKPFLNNVLGATYINANYAAMATDYTYCLPINQVAGGYLAGFTSALYARTNGCTGMFDVLGVSGSAPNAKAERKYDNQAAPNYAIVGNAVNVVGGANYKTLSEGYDNCLLRTQNTLGYPACGNDDVLTAWMNAVLSWANFSTATICTPGPVGIDPNTFAAPAVVASLAQAYPNPMNPTATIWYTVGAPGKVTLKVFDVSGRVIRTLVNESKATGRYPVIWDGTTDRGEKVASGVFFYQFEAPGYRSAKKLVIVQ